jgi:hypothetical protein
MDRAKVTANLELTAVYDILEVLRSSVGTPSIVGHGANGLLAKALPLEIDSWRFSFEGPQLKDSPMATLAGAEEDADSSRIMNFYSDGSFTAKADPSALTNNRIPTYRTDMLSSWVPPQPFETFCFFAAACGNDDRFDELCVEVLDNKTYMDLWEKLGRSRGTLNETMAKAIAKLREEAARELAH